MASVQISSSMETLRNSENLLKRRVSTDRCLYASLIIWNVNEHLDSKESACRMFQSLISNWVRSKISCRLTVILWLTKITIFLIFSWTNWRNSFVPKRTTCPRRRTWISSTGQYSLVTFLVIVESSFIAAIISLALSVVKHFNFLVKSDHCIISTRSVGVASTMCGVGEQAKSSTMFCKSQLLYTQYNVVVK